MTHLIPQPRVDKNGRTTVRWMKNDASDTASKPLPAVSLSPSKRDMLKSRIELSVILNEAKYDNDQNVDDFIADASDETIISVLEHLKNDDGAAGWQVAWMADREIEEDTVAEYLALYDVHEDWDDIEDTVKFIRGLHYHERNRERVDPADELSLSRNKALLKFAFAVSDDDSPASDMVDYVRIEGKDRYGSAVVSSDAFEAICQHPERVDELIDFVVERGESGIELFNTTMNSSPDPLVRGQL